VADAPHDAYAPPKAPVDNEVVPRRGWVVYFWALVALGVIGTVPCVLELRTGPPRLLALGLAVTALDAMGIAGLWGYAYRRRLLARPPPCRRDLRVGDHTRHLKPQLSALGLGGGR